MTFEAHYKNHLHRFYSWMFGGFDQMVVAQKAFFTKHSIVARGSMRALDLGCGSGFQSIALQQLGFEVTGVDLSVELLTELRNNAPTIRTLRHDIRDLSFLGTEKPDLIVCMGDTLTHLGSAQEAKDLIAESSNRLADRGKLVFTFRNLLRPRNGIERFFVVRSDDNRILTCFLEDAGAKVIVHDLLHEKSAAGWQLKASAYEKLKLDPKETERWVAERKLKTRSEESSSGLVTIIGQK